MLAGGVAVYLSTSEDEGKSGVQLTSIAVVHLSLGDGRTAGLFETSRKKKPLRQLINTKVTTETGVLVIKGQAVNEAGEAGKNEVWYFHPRS